MKKRHLFFRQIHSFRSACFILFFTLLTLPTLAGENGLMRFPDIHGDMVVFVSGEDIWRAPVSGGTAIRLTFHEGEERFPKFSPDGKWIAFTGEYDGNEDVYVMDIDGGNITRLTYHPGADIVVGWHPVKNKIIFSSRRHSYSRFDRLFMVSPDGSGLEELPLHEAAQGSFSPDGKQIAYNKIGREGRTWKRYRGGMAQDIYIYDFETQQNRRITDYIGTDRIPMWIGNKIYFSSDRDGMLNLYAYDLASGKTEQLTRHSDYDVRRPSEGGDKIVYEHGGDLWVLDTQTGQTRQLNIDIRMDMPDTRPYLKKVDDYITQFALSPSGKRALIVARGEIFSVPREHGTTRNLTQSSGARERHAVWSPDGKYIAYFSDADGEYNLYLREAGSNKAPQKLTDFRDGYRHALRWSPDSKKLSFTDQTLRLFVMDLATRKLTEVDKAQYENVDVALDRKPIFDHSWSPDSRYIAYSMMNENLVYQIYIYDLQTGQKHSVSSGLYSDFNPVFSPDGTHLLFISNRRFDPTFCDIEWEMVYKKIAGIYSLTLRKNGTPLLPLQSDEEPVAEPKADKKSKKKNNKRDNAGGIDFEGIAERVEALPLPRGNYRDLSVTEDALFYLNAEDGDFNRFEFRGPGKQSLYAYSLKNRKEETVIENVSGYALSADGSSIIYRQGKKIGIIDASARNSSGNALDLSGLTMWLDPLAEWRQMFEEAWRMERDFYYEPDMHGVDWPAMREKYGKLMDRATCRQDVRYIIGELIGELNTSHTYIYGGDLRRKADRVNVGMLGADYEVDAAANRYRFKKIYREPDWTDEVFPPLGMPGVDVREGDYLLAVNGQEVTADRNIYSYFQNLAGQQVTLLVNNAPTKVGAREFVVKPLRNEYDLRYLSWLEHNRKVVDEASNGQIGYLHLPDTYTGSTKIFPKYFYSQTRKKGLIVDGRFNAGGLDPDIFLQRLDKKVLAYWTRRYSHDQTTPAVVTRSHKVCLTNRQAGSGGDMLPMEFRMRGMGPIIGTRTWGGLVGVSMFIDLIDGGGMTAPDYRIYDPQGKWIVENEGVTPDIEVDLDPAEMQRGYDAQLMKGVEVLLEKIKADPLPWPQHEPFPVDRPGK
jgi:tricorn protease